MKGFARFVLIVISLFCIATPLLASTLQVSIPDTSGITVQADPEGIVLFSGTDMNFMADPGQPDIPFILMKVLLPAEADLSTVQVSLSDVRSERIMDSVIVQPAKPPVTWDGEKEIILWPEGRDIQDGKDMAVYTGSLPFPEDVVFPVRTGEIRGFKVVDVPVALFQFHPLQGSLFKLVGANLCISYSDTAQPLVSGSYDTGSDRIAEEMVKDAVVNFGSVASSYGIDAYPLAGSTEPQPATGGFAIITTSNIIDNSSMLGTFAEWKENMGYDVFLVSQAQWGGGTGDAAAENIRNWLKDNYQSKNLKYVLLLGDPDPFDGDVPMKMLWPRNNATSYTDNNYRQSPSDLYYADLSGNWDKDGDGFFGEGDDDMVSGGIDTNWEVYVGRIPFYGRVSDLDNILVKLMNYENVPASETQWRMNVLLPMKPSDDSTPGYQLGESIKDNIIPSTWGYHRIYDESYGLTPAPERIPCTSSNVTNDWKNGSYGAVVWWTHGSATSASSVMDSASASQLDNNRPSMVFQASCSNAYPENSNNLSYALLKNGAVTAIGSTRISWYIIGQTYYSGSSSSAGLSYDFSRKIIQEGKNCGDALFLVKQGKYPSSYWWMNFTDFNIYGDPSISLAASSNIDYYDVSGRVMLEEGTPLSGATVTVEGEFVSRQTSSNLNGYYSVDVPSGNYLVRVSKPTYEFSPREANIEITSGNASGPVFVASPLDEPTRIDTPTGGGGGGGCNVNSAFSPSCILLLMPLSGMLRRKRKRGQIRV
ncbi:MAG: carboxypeptidase regulatory-like domain-containing protein [Synergistales bacterium]|nr:carboxypeptidase regulatory-like domain-containing protein [Synergistales bacterium]